MVRALLAFLLLALPCAARADWYEASTAHFVVYADRDPEKLKEFATNLERLDRAIRLMVGQADTPVGKASRVTIFTVANEAEVQKLLAGAKVAGFFVPRASGSIAVVPQQKAGSGDLAHTPLQVLLHEYAHHLMFSLAPNSVYPAWVTEGFAEFNATAKFGKDGSVTLGEPPLYRGISVMSGNNMPIEKLLTRNAATGDLEEINDFYARAWLLMHYLRIGAPKRSGQLGAYLAALNAGKSSLDAARAAFGDLKQLDNELEVYKKKSMPISTLSGAQLAIGAVTVHKLSAGAAATVELQARSKLAVLSTERQDVLAIYADAQRAAAPYPNDPDAQLVLAGAALDAGDYAGAEAAADRVLAADPKAVRALTYKATSRMALARKAGDARAETWNGIRALLSAANRIDPRDPVPLSLYYRSYLQQRAAPPEIAKDGLNSAFEMAPYDAGLRLTTAAMYLMERNGAAARLLLGPLAYDPHGRGPVELARKLIARIDAGDLDGAISTLEKPGAAN